MAQRMVRQMVLKPWSWVQVTRVSCEGGIVGGATNFFFFNDKPDSKFGHLLEKYKPKYK